VILVAVFGTVEVAQARAWPVARSNLTGFALTTGAVRITDHSLTRAPAGRLGALSAAQGSSCAASEYLEWRGQADPGEIAVRVSDQARAAGYALSDSGLRKNGDRITLSFLMVRADVRVVGVIQAGNSQNAQLAWCRLKSGPRK